MTQKSYISFRIYPISGQESNDSNTLTPSSTVTLFSRPFARRLASYLGWLKSMFSIPYQPTVRVNISLEAISIRKVARVKASVNTRNGVHEGDLCSRGLWEGEGEKTRKIPSRAPMRQPRIFLPRLQIVDRPRYLFVRPLLQSYPRGEPWDIWNSREVARAKKNSRGWYPLDDFFSSLVAAFGEWHSCRKRRR